MNREYTLIQGGRLLWDGEVARDEYALEVPVRNAGEGQRKSREETFRGTVIICPGGGYEWLSPREAKPVAAAFEAGGWNPAILYYTVGQNLGTLPLMQLGEAVDLVRERGGDGPVVVCGFSAGGHLAASLGVHWRKIGFPKPDGLILCYPVITAGKYRHEGSIRNLAGEGDPSFFGLEHHVTADMPPAFLWHTVTDPTVPVQNSLLMAEAMVSAGLACELIIYPRGVHGLSLATPEVEEPQKGRLADEHIAGWFPQCLDWLNTLSKLPRNEPGITIKE